MGRSLTMHKSIWTVCGILLSGAALAQAAEKPEGPAGLPAGAVICPADGTNCILCDGCGCPCGPRLYGSAEYLLWWIKDGPMPAPLATAGLDPANPDTGILGAPGTRVLFGGNDIDYGTFSGMRGTIGYWLDDCRTLGVELSGFLLERQSVVFGAQSNPQGFPVLGMPFVNVDGDQQSQILFANPAGFAGFFPRTEGAIGITTSTRFWGTDANLVLKAWECCGTRVDLLAGFRYLRLDEDLKLYGRVSIPDAANLLARPSEGFDTRNQFYGGQLGARLRWQGQRLDYTVQGLIALGANRQSVGVTGGTIITDDVFPPLVFPGAVYTQATNLGSRSDNRFSFVPAVQFQVGYCLTQNLRATVGYNFIYWDGVARPGEQVDNVLNLTQSPIFGFDQLIGQPRPAPRFERSDFFAHGVSFGLEVRY
jgi:hypothetical protein